MENTRDTLGKIQAISVIFASIAVPLLVAYFTWQSQKQINEQTLRKDYMELAVKVLNDKSSEQDNEIREWAKNIFKTAKDTNQTSAPEIHYIPMPLNIEIPKSLMEPPLKWKALDETQPTTVDDLMVNYIENVGRFKQNVILVEALQKTIIVLTGKKENGLTNSLSGTAKQHTAP